MSVRQSSKSQLFSLFLLTGKCLELRNLGERLTLDRASDMIGRLKELGESPEEVRKELIELGAEVKGTPKEVKPSTRVNFQAVYDEAHAAGMAAGSASVPRPMVVNSLSNPLDETSVKESWYVADGVCGFAWIHFKGNTAWGKWTKENKLSSPDYPSGFMIWASGFNQSMDRKEKYAYAFVAVLRKYGIEASARSRMD